MHYDYFAFLMWLLQLEYEELVGSGCTLLEACKHINYN